MMTHVLLDSDRVDISTTGDAVSLGGVLCGLKDIDGWHNGPGVRKNRADRLWAHGEFSERGWRTARLITISGHIRTTTRAEAGGFVDRLATVFADGTPGQFIFTDPDLGTRWANCTLEGAPKTAWTQQTRIDWELELLAADPRKYGLPVEAAGGVPVDGGALAFDLFTQGTMGVLDFGAPGSTGVVELTNVGTADTAPVFTVTGTMPSGFTVENRATGARLVFAGAVVTGQVVRLDSGSGDVTVNGVDRGVLLVRREWEMLDPGETGSWVLTAADSVGALMVVEVIPAWW